MPQVLRDRNRDSDGGGIKEWSLIVALALLAIASIPLSYRLASFVGSHFEQWTTTSNGTAKEQFSFHAQPIELPDIELVDSNNQSGHLSKLYGQPILLNLWATWCVPCRNEMPSFDRLQAKFKSSELLVLALSMDRGGIPAIKEFYRGLGLVALGIYIDPSGQALNRLGGVGLPTTLFLNREGKEIGRTALVNYGVIHKRKNISIAALWFPQQTYACDPNSKSYYPCPVKKRGGFSLPRKPPEKL